MVTVQLDQKKIKSQLIRSNINTIVEALTERGYNPISQLSGYIVSRDPAYITGYKNARNLVCEMGIYELLDELIEFYLKNEKNDQ